MLDRLREIPPDARSFKSASNFGFAQVCRPHFFIFPAHQTLHASFAGASWRLEAIGRVSSLQGVPRLQPTSDQGLRRPARNQSVGYGEARNPCRAAQSAKAALVSRLPKPGLNE